MFRPPHHHHPTPTSAQQSAGGHICEFHCNKTGSPHKTKQSAKPQASHTQSASQLRGWHRATLAPNLSRNSLTPTITRAHQENSYHKAPDLTTLNATKQHRPFTTEKPARAKKHTCEQDKVRHNSAHHEADTAQHKHRERASAPHFHTQSGTANQARMQIAGSRCATSASLG